MRVKSEKYKNLHAKSSLSEVGVNFDLRPLQIKIYDFCQNIRNEKQWNFSFGPTWMNFLFIGFCDYFLFYRTGKERLLKEKEPQIKRTRMVSLLLTAQAYHPLFVWWTVL